MQSNLLYLMEYNFWANDLFIVRLKDHNRLSERVTKLLGHLLRAHQIWNGRINRKSNLPLPWDPMNPNEWEELNMQLYHQTSDCIKSTALDKVISYKNSKGDLYENQFWEIVYHIINHSTHHRGQVAMAMRENGMIPPASDLIFYLRR